MSRILRRPMFRGGRVNSYGTGIASGLANGGRVGFFNGGTSGGEFLRKARVRGPRDLGIIQTLPNRINIGTSRRPKFIDAPLYEEFPEVRQFPLTADASNVMTDATITETPDKETEEIKATASVEEGLPISVLPKEKEEKTPKVNEVDEAEVTMTDLEKALGLDDAKREYASDALAAASKAFFEGRGFEAISDAAQVKSKAPEIKRLAGLEEFKAKKAQKLYETKLKAQSEQKAGTKGALQKDIDFIKSQPEGSQGQILALKKYGFEPDIGSELRSRRMEGLGDANLTQLGRLYFPQTFKGVISADTPPEIDGTYILEDASALIIVSDGKSSIQKLK